MQHKKSKSLVDISNFSKTKDLSKNISLTVHQKIQVTAKNKQKVFLETFGHEVT